MKQWLKRVLVMLGLGMLLLPGESDSGGSDSDSGGSDSGSSDSGDSLNSSVSGSNTVDILASIFSGDPTMRRPGISDESSGGSSDTSSESSETTTKRKRKSPQSTEGLSSSDLSHIPYSEQYDSFDDAGGSDDGGGSDSSE